MSESTHAVIATFSSSASLSQACATAICDDVGRVITQGGFKVAAVRLANVPVDESARDRIDKAIKALGEACKRGSIRMCVPVQEDDDDKLILEGLHAGRDLLDELARADLREHFLRAHIAQLEAPATVSASAGGANAEQPA